MSTACRSLSLSAADLLLAADLKLPRRYIRLAYKAEGMGLTSLASFKRMSLGSWRAEEIRTPNLLIRSQKAGNS